MEENLEIILNVQDKQTVFEMKEPKKVNREVFTGLRGDLYSPNKNTTSVIYPTQKIIDVPMVYAQDLTKLI